jgi:subtilase family serine protease
MPAALAQQDRITGPIDTSRSVVLDSKVAPLALAQRGDEGAVEPSRQLPWIALWFKRTPAQQDALTRLLAEQQDPSSPNYHKWLSSEEFADRFGLSRNDIDKIAAWLQGQGFKVAYVARDRDFVAFSGTAEQVRTTFHTEIHRYTIHGEAHIMNAAAPSVPAALASIVWEIHGLNDLRPRPGVVRGKPVSGAADHPSYTSSTGLHSLAPDDIATIYDIAPLYKQAIDGFGQNMVVVGQSNISLADLQEFRTNFNLPGGDPEVIECCGPDPGLTNSETEADLDLEWVSGVARNANVIFVYASDAEYAAQYAIDQDLAPVISHSFATCEPEASSTGFSPSGFEALALTANSKGITWVAGSGDTGAAGCDSQTSTVASLGLAVGLPASVPEVTAVGGTEFDGGSGTYWSTTNSSTGESALGYIPETAWNDTVIATVHLNLDATGGGMSIFYSKPYWQTGPGVPNDGMRDVPDVSLTASPNVDPYRIVNEGAWQEIGGTSASTPVMAGIVVLLNQSLAAAGKSSAGNINPMLYSLAQTHTTITHTSSTIFNDITTGNNIVPCTAGSPDCVGGSEGYSAGVGYDQVTGLGSVDAYNLVTALKSGVPTQTIVSANPSSILTSGSTQLWASVESSTGTPTGSVAFAAGSTTLGTVVMSGAAASLTVYGSQLATGSNLIVATYGGDSTFSGSAGSVSVTVTPGTASQTITFGPLANRTLGTAPFTVSATASSDLPVSFNSQTTSVCTVSGSLVTLVAVGTCTIRATQAGNATYAAATPVNQSFQVTPAGGGSGTSGLVIPHVVDGGGWQTTFGITNTTATTATATLQFYQQTDNAGDTQAWTPPLTGAVSTTNIQLAPGATVFLQTLGTAPTLTQGFGEMIASAGVQGYAIFTWHVGSGYQDGTALAAAPGGTILVPFDNSSGIVTGIAVVNASGSAETLSANLRLASGQVVPGSLPSIPSLGHTSFTLPSLFPQSAGQQGTLELSSSAGTFSVVGLRFHASGAFTSLPVYAMGAAPF